MSSLGKVRFHICGGEIKPWPEAACQCVGANDFDPVARIAELEALVQMRTEANKHKQARVAELEEAERKHKRIMQEVDLVMVSRAKRIAELEEQQDRQIVAVAEAVDEAREEGYAKCKADVLAMAKLNPDANGKVIYPEEVEALRGEEEGSTPSCP